MHALFLVAFFSFLQISNLVPYALVDCHSNNAYFLRHQDVSVGCGSQGIQDQNYTI